MPSSNRALAVLSLVRWENALLSVAGVVLGAWWATGMPGQPKTIVMAGVAILLTAFANADNDVRDYEIDCIAHPDASAALGRALAVLGSHHRWPRSVRARSCCPRCSAAPRRSPLLA